MADPEHEDYVIICGCPIGVEWTIQHLEGGDILHITPLGAQAVIGQQAYKEIVMKFAHEVETFYERSKPKNIPTEEFERKGYEAFWKEWQQLKRAMDK